MITPPMSSVTQFTINYKPERALRGAKEQGMNDLELRIMFAWAAENLMKFEVRDCEESEHYYFDGERVGGFAGDAQSYFYEQGDAASKLVKLFDAGVAL
jgi:hypothetical protein